MMLDRDNLREILAAAAVTDSAESGCPGGSYAHPGKTARMNDPVAQEPAARKAVRNNFGFRVVVRRKACE